jgi:hypothetical protein
MRWREVPPEEQEEFILAIQAMDRLYIDFVAKSQEKK